MVCSAGDAVARRRLEARDWATIRSTLAAGDHDSMGGAMKDMIDISSVEFHSSPEEVKAWSITVPLTGIHLKADHVDESGVAPLFDRTRWPEFVPPGWDGPLQSTLWLFVPVDGRWHGAAIIEFWKGRVWSGAPLLAFYTEWIYNNQWGPEMQRYVPREGDTVGFMVSAGQLRLNKNLISVRERSNIVTCRLVGDAQYSFTEGAVPGGGPPAPPPAQDQAEQLRLLHQIADAVATLTAKVESLDAKAAQLQTLLGQVSRDRTT
jgi:hypothetical protein